MITKTRFSPGNLAGILYTVITFLEFLLLIWGPYKVDTFLLIDFPYLFLLFIQWVWGLWLLVIKKKKVFLFIKRFICFPEYFLILTLLLFVFAYIFALNANMDYIQRFVKSGGNLRMALDTAQERKIALIRYLPLLLLNLYFYLYSRIKRKYALKRLFCSSESIPLITIWSIPFVCMSIFLSVISFPSFISLEGFPFIAWIAVVPLFLVIKSNKTGNAIFYGVVYGVFTSTFMNFWLGTFSLVSLQLVIIFFFLFYLIFMGITVVLYKKTGRWSLLVFPFAWVIFEYLRTTGFLAYPWGIWGTSQYSILPIIQIASITGVWGISFIILLCNSGFTETLYSIIKKRSLRIVHIIVAILVPLVVYGSGWFYLRNIEDAESRSYTISLIQHNSDARKHDYWETFSTLQELTDIALKENPDLVVWSETAFVPNIRRWSKEDPKFYSLARLVRKFLKYIETINTYLVTGNDDYKIIRDEKGKEVERLDYNATVLFDDKGERLETYHKVKLVPFTEYFPYKQQFPWFYNLLLEYDVHFWEPGDEKLVFDGPGFKFCTPICFEDVFPYLVRDFILNGAEVIINVSNDYWSLTEVEAKQHYIGSLFRAIENRRPLLRASASGRTAFINRYGKLISSLPYYEEGQLTETIHIREKQPVTFYTKYGDWFPMVLMVFIGVMVVWTSILLLKQWFCSDKTTGR